MAGRQPGFGGRINSLLIMSVWVRLKVRVRNFLKMLHGTVTYGIWGRAKGRDYKHDSAFLEDLVREGAREG